MPAPRLIGQDNELSVQVDQQTITTMAITSSEMTFRLVTKETGVLGETFDRVDEIYKGMSGTIEFQAGGPDVLTMIQIIVDRARRRTPPRPRFTLKSQYTFPESGRRGLIVVPDLKFQDIPIGSSSREEHVTFRYQWMAEIATVVFIS
jgi:hypothetical protein